MNKRKTSTTIYDVAELSGYSIATVSRVLNSPERVSERARESVLTAIDDLGFEPKTDARERARKEVGRIGVIIPFFTLPSFSQRLRGIAAAVVDSRYDLTIYPVNSQAHLDSYLTVLPFSRQIDGLIIVSLPVDDSSLKRLKKSAIPTLLVENHIDGFSSVEINNFNGGELAADHFIKKKHTKCAYIGNTITPDYSLSPEDDRLNGYRKTLTRNGLSLPEEYIKLSVFPPINPDKQVEELLGLPDSPTAIFAATDELALRVLKVAQKKDIQIPEELALIGFDDIEFAEYLELTTINQSLQESGKLAVEHLISQIADPSRPIENTFIQLKLIERNTT